MFCPRCGGGLASRRVSEIQKAGVHSRRIYSPLPGLNNSFAQVSLLKFAPSLFFILLLAPDSLLHAHSQRWLTSFHFLRDHSLALSLLVAFDSSWNALRVPTTNTSTCHGMQTAVLFTSLLLIAGDAPCWFLYLGRLAKKKGTSRLVDIWIPVH